MENIEGFNLELSDFSFSKFEIEKLDDFKFSFEEVSTDSTSISSISSQLEVPQPESSGPEEWAELFWNIIRCQTKILRINIKFYKNMIHRNQDFNIQLLEI